MSTRRIIVLGVVLMFILSATVFAATPWISVINPNPQTIWQKSTESMVPNTDPLTVWQSGNEYMVVWDSVGLTGNVKIDLMKDGTVATTLSPAGGIPIGNVGKGFMKTLIYATAGPGQYQVRVSSMESPSITSISEPVSIIVK